MASNRDQLEGLRAERAGLQGEAQQLAAALADSEAQLQALAKRNGELRWVWVGGWMWAKPGGQGGAVHCCSKVSAHPACLFS